ncbi:alpha-D-mannose-specific plant lectins domain-containing protein [Dioscorea alata]|uniref:Alpha-D-mannose-specific plant lectins domain-containing protein n=1 Tax=Dioscorea alata TaxID=55571 RepID=A0ACB7WGS6_DIOAL|nr:alpha-D-mannose-specific plant lectins domain-containing protein [Dioscorea alata]
MAIPRAFASLSLGLTLVLVVAPLSSMASNILYPGKTLQPGKSLTEGSYSFTMGTDCDAVLSENGNLIWETDTKYRDINCYLSVSETGNLIIHRPSGTTLWQTNKNGEKGNYILVLQEDGNLVIYGPDLWATGTSLLSFGGVFIETNPTTFVALPANKAKKEAKALRISMVTSKE